METEVSEIFLNEKFRKALKKGGIDLSDEQVQFFVVAIPLIEEKDSGSFEEEKDSGSFEGKKIFFKRLKNVEQNLQKQIEQYDTPKEAKSNERINKFQKYLEDNQEYVFYKKEIEGSTNYLALKWMLFFGAVLNENALGYKAFLEYAFEILAENFQDMSQIDTIYKIKGTEEPNYLKKFHTNWRLMGNFVDSYLNKKGLPNKELLIELSSAKYEGSESEARIYFGEEKETLETIETLTRNSDEALQLNSDNLRTIRKFMELSKRKYLYLYADKEEKKVENDKENVSKYEFYLSELVKKKAAKDKGKKNLYIKFSGYLYWSICCNGREELTYKDGRYILNSSKNNKEYENVIIEVTKNSIIDEDMLRKLTKILEKQKHGTSVIIISSEKEEEAIIEVERLCNMNRGIRLTGNISYDKHNKKWDKKMLLSLTSIDGALFMNSKGQCLAMGVIVDGEVIEKGDLRYGARYNSICNYVKLKTLTKTENRVTYIAIIVSEDGMINIIRKDNFIE